MIGHLSDGLLYSLIKLGHNLLSILLQMLMCGELQGSGGVYYFGGTYLVWMCNFNHVKFCIDEGDCFNSSNEFRKDDEFRLTFGSPKWTTMELSGWLGVQRA